MGWAVLAAFMLGCCAGFVGVIFVVAYGDRPMERRAVGGDCGAAGGAVAGDEPASAPVSLEEKNNSVSEAS